MMFYIDGKYRDGIEGPRSAFEWVWDSTSVANGTHAIAIKAVDATGNWTTKSVEVDVRN